MSKWYKEKCKKKYKPTYTLGITGDQLISRSGLLALLEMLEALKIEQ